MAEPRTAEYPRWPIPAAGLAATALLTAVAMVHYQLYLRILRLMIVWPGSRPFMDWSVTPRIIRCAAEGVNVYLPNRCGVMLNYSPLWTELPFLPSGHFWDCLFGFSFALLFFLTLGRLGPPRDRTELTVRLLATLSPATLLAVERGNVDILMFMLVAVCAWLVAGQRRRLPGYGLLVLAGLFKFYPMAALYLALRERRPVMLGTIVVALLATAALVVSFRAEFGMILGNLPTGGLWTLEFTSVALPTTVADKLQSLSGVRIAGLAAALRLALLLAMLGGGAAVARACVVRGIGLPADPGDRALLVASGAVMLFCFVIGQNYLYRGIFLLSALPGLFALARTARREVRRPILALCALIAFVLWLPPIHALLARFVLPPESPGVAGLRLFAELAWWAIATALCGVLILFALTSPSFAAIRHRRWRAAPPQISASAASSRTISGGSSASAAPSASKSAGASGPAR